MERPYRVVSTRFSPRAQRADSSVAEKRPVHGDGNARTEDVHLAGLDMERLPSDAAAGRKRAPEDGLPEDGLPENGLSGDVRRSPSDSQCGSRATRQSFVCTSCDGRWTGRTPKVFAVSTADLGFGRTAVSVSATVSPDHSFSTSGRARTTKGLKNRVATTKQRAAGRECTDRIRLPIVSVPSSGKAFYGQLKFQIPSSDTSYLICIDFETNVVRSQSDFPPTQRTRLV